MTRHLGWAVWLSATTSSFAVMEYRALVDRKSSATLSESLSIWSKWLGPWAPVAFLGFWTALTMHVVRFRVMEETR